ncbi:hypothetical protein [Roseovarius autotrophicus]|uniref:hypothetical protein n=1 Tax=Roseovarius autotrophicus TaxID=2824121 RepID=UPI001A0C6B51|nr:hypothetical protein [Roseovarius autotrophicus]MBE0454960.1 hypothetical protein [Roseovarius sp.]
MADIHQGFTKRLRQIDLKRSRLERGYVGKVRDDGLIEFRPRRRLPSVPLRGLIYLIFGFAFFKAVVLAHLGVVTYQERHALLAQGNPLEQAGAFVMQPDPLTGFLASQIGRALR